MSRFCCFILLISIFIMSTSAGLPSVGSKYGAKIEGYQSYFEQTTCVKAVQTGVSRVAQFFKAAYPTVGNPWAYIRPCTAPGVTEHKDGRAIDYMLNATNPTSKAVADAVLKWLLATDAHGNKHAMARRMGIMYMLFNNRVWRAYRTPTLWQPQVYGGKNCSTLTSRT